MYGAKKTYGIYNTLSDSFRSLTGGGNEKEISKTETESERALTAYLSLNQSHFLQLDIFKKS